MGCFVLKGTYVDYQTQLSLANSTLSDLESRLEKRREENPYNDIDLQDRTDYLSYQEQLRARQVLAYLSKFISTNGQSVPEISIENPSSNYLETKYQQTQIHQQLAEKFRETTNKLEDIHKKEKKEIESRLAALGDLVLKKIENGANILDSLKIQIKEISKFDSLESLIESLLRMSEMQKDLEFLQRRCDYKDFLLSQEAKIKAKEDMALKIEEMKNDIDKLNANWAEMKEKQRKAAEEMHYLQDTIESNKRHLIELDEEKSCLSEFLNDSDNYFGELKEVKDVYEKKKSQLEQLENEFVQLSESTGDVEVLEDPAQLHIISKKLKSDISQLNSQISYLKDLKKASSEELKARNTKEIESKLAINLELREEVQEKEEEIENLKITYKIKLKEQLAARIAQSFKVVPKNVLTKWSFFRPQAEKLTEEAKYSNPILNILNKKDQEPAWEVSKVFEFFKELIVEKSKKDEQAIKESKLPISLPEFVLEYLQTKYDKDNEIQLSGMVNCLISDASTDPLFILIKRMFSLTHDSFSYIFTYFLTIALSDFEKYAGNTESAPFEKIFVLIEDYLKNNKEIGSKVLYLMKPENISNEEYVLLHLRYRLTKSNLEFSQVFEGPEEFVSTAQNELKPWVDSSLLEDFKVKCEQEFDINFDMKIEMSINSLQPSKFMVKKIDFLTALIEVYMEVKQNEIKILEESVQDVQEINEEEFKKALIKIDSSISSDMSEKLFTESVIDCNDMFKITPTVFAQVVTKYGIGGYGVGPFKSREISNMLSLLLRKFGKNTKEDAINEAKKLSGLTQVYKIVTNALPYKNSKKGNLKIPNARNNSDKKILSPVTALRNQRTGSRSPVIFK